MFLANAGSGRGSGKATASQPARRRSVSAAVLFRHDSARHPKEQHTPPMISDYGDGDANMAFSDNDDDADSMQDRSSGLHRLTLPTQHVQVLQPQRSGHGQSSDQAQHFFSAGFEMETEELRADGSVLCASPGPLMHADQRPQSYNEPPRLMDRRSPSTMTALRPLGDNLLAPRPAASAPRHSTGSVIASDDLAAFRDAHEHGTLERAPAQGMEGPAAAAAATAPRGDNLKKRLFDVMDTDTSACHDEDDMQCMDDADSGHDTSSQSLAVFDERDALGVPDTFATPPSSRRKPAAQARIVQDGMPVHASSLFLAAAAEGSPPPSAAHPGMPLATRGHSRVPLKRTLSTPVNSGHLGAPERPGQGIISRPPRSLDDEGPLVHARGAEHCRRGEGCGVDGGAGAAAAPAPRQPFGAMGRAGLVRRTGSEAVHRAQGGVALSRNSFRSVGCVARLWKNLCL